jgi:hypothetical protein
MLVGVLLQFVAVCLMTCAVDCASLVDNPKRKKKLRMISGILVTVSGVLILSVAIMMIVVIGKQYHQTMYYMTYQGYGQDPGRGRRLAEAGNKPMKFGPGIYLSLLAGLMSIVGGGMMLCQGCGQSDQEDYYDTGYEQGSRQDSQRRIVKDQYL